VVVGPRGFSAISEAGDRSRPPAGGILADSCRQISESPGLGVPADLAQAVGQIAGSLYAKMECFIVAQVAGVKKPG